MLNTCTPGVCSQTGKCLRRCTTPTPLNVTNTELSSAAVAYRQWLCETFSTGNIKQIKQNAIKKTDCHYASKIFSAISECTLAVQPPSFCSFRYNYTKLIASKISCFSTCDPWHTVRGEQGTDALDICTLWCSALGRVPGCQKLQITA